MICFEILCICSGFKNSCVRQVVARDDDLGANGQISYTLTSGNEAGSFSLTSGGQLNLIRTLDRETQDRYTLVITAHDAGKKIYIQRSGRIQHRSSMSGLKGKL